jgi:hypothetical protein
MTVLFLIRQPSMRRRVWRKRVPTEFEQEVKLRVRWAPAQVKREVDKSDHN